MNAFFVIFALLANAYKWKHSRSVNAHMIETTNNVNDILRATVTKQWEKSYFSLYHST